MHTIRGISLRQLVDEDMPFLFRLFSDPARCHLWMQGREAFDESGFHQAWAAWTTDTIAAKFVVESGGRAVGLVFEYDRVLDDGHTKVTALLREDSVGHGGGVVACALLVDWLFRGLPFRKVYLDVYGYNPQVLAMLRRLQLPEEAILRGNRFWDGKYWDLHVFAVYREVLPDLCARLLRVQRVEPSCAAVARRELDPTPNHTHENGRPSRVGSGTGDA